MENIEPYCTAHHKDGMFRCDNPHCNKFVCSLCMQESEEFEDLLPSKISFFCFSCVNELKMERVTDPIHSKNDICQKVIYEGKVINHGLVTQSDKKDKQPVGNQHPLSSENLKPKSTSGKMSSDTRERVSASFNNNDFDGSLLQNGLLTQVETALEDTPDNEKQTNELSNKDLQYLNPVRRNLFSPTQQDTNFVYDNSTPEDGIGKPGQSVSTSTVIEVREAWEKV